MADKGKELVEKEEKNLNLMGGNPMEGLEDIDETAISLPRVKLLQATSPEVQGEEYADLNLRAGNLIELISKEKISGVFIPVKVLPSTNVLFVPRTAEGKTILKEKKQDITDEDLAQQGGMICISTDGKVGDRYGECSKCGLCLFQGNEKPICQRSINILVMLDTGMPAIVSFRDTSYKHGSRFLSLLRNKALTGTRMQSCKYKLSPTKRTRGDQQWYELTVVLNGNATEEEAMKAYEMYKMYSNMNNINIVEEQEQVVDNSNEDVSEII